MRLTASQARACRAVRMGYVIYDDRDERFYGAAVSQATLELLDREGCLVVEWHNRRWRRVPVRLSGSGELALMAYERRLEDRKEKPRAAGAAEATAHEVGGIHERHE